MLRLLGCQIDIVADGRQAVDAVSRVAYDVVLMDCQMPELDGYAATRAIRALEQAGRIPRPLDATTPPRLPIIALTAHALDGDRERSLAAGMDEHLSKPLSLKPLRAVLARLLAAELAVAAAPASPAAAPGPLPEPPPSPEPATTPLDPQTLAELRALQQTPGRDVLTRVLRLYATTAPSVVDELRTAVAAGDGDAIRRIAHRFKSSSAHVGAKRLAALSADLEAIGGGPTAACSIFAQLEEEFTTVQAAVAAQLDAPQPSPAARA
jgi:CheY-like chemotaxis protein/HPt (histidine-containing phosphotransfer) domain-containing protein